MTIYLFSQIQKFTKYSIKLIEKLSRRLLINSSDVFVIKCFTVAPLVLIFSILMRKENLSAVPSKHSYSSSIRGLSILYAIYFSLP